MSRRVFDSKKISEFKHDLRTHLNTIINTVGFAEEDYNKKDKLLAELADIRKASEEILRITEIVLKEKTNKKTPSYITGVQDDYDPEKSKRILVVEDDPTSMAITVRLLERQGYICDFAQNGKEALDKVGKCKDGAYLAILMDVVMPVIDGVAATRMIRALENDFAKSVPIIAMTANTHYDEMSECFEAGMNAFLSKPIYPERLFVTLESYGGYKTRK